MGRRPSGPKGKTSGCMLRRVGLVVYDIIIRWNWMLMLVTVEFHVRVFFSIFFQFNQN